MNAKNFTQKSIEALQSAQSLAQARRSSNIAPEHLLYALLAQENGLIPSLFTLMLGAILAFGLEWVGYDALVQRIGGIDSLQLFKFVEFQELLIPMVVVFVGAGMFVGIVGSWTSIRKFMDV